MLDNTVEMNGYEKERTDMGTSPLTEASLDDLISMHKNIKDKTPFWHRRTIARLEHALSDFNSWKELAKKNDDVFNKYYLKYFDKEISL